MSDVRIQNSEFRNDHGEPRTGSPLVYLSSEFCTLMSDVFAVDYRRKYLCCSNQIHTSIAKLMANARKPRMRFASSVKSRGTSRETTSRVIAKPKTASLNPSMRETS